MKHLKKLFTPIKIGSMELKNRIVMAPMPTTWAPNSVYSFKADLEYSFLNYTHNGLYYRYDEVRKIMVAEENS